MANNMVMNIAELIILLSAIGKEVGDDYQVWLSSDEDGNEHLPIFENPELCLEIDKPAKKIIFYPSHY